MIRNLFITCTEDNKNQATFEFCTVKGPGIESQWKRDTIEGSQSFVDEYIENSKVHATLSNLELFLLHTPAYTDNTSDYQKANKGVAFLVENRYNRKLVWATLYNMTPLIGRIAEYNNSNIFDKKALTSLAKKITEFIILEYQKHL